VGEVVLEETTLIAVENEFSDVASERHVGLRQERLIEVGDRLAGLGLAALELADGLLGDLVLSRCSCCLLEHGLLLANCFACGPLDAIGLVAVEVAVVVVETAGSAPAAGLPSAAGFVCAAVSRAFSARRASSCRFIRCERESFFGLSSSSVSSASRRLRPRSRLRRRRLRRPQPALRLVLAGPRCFAAPWRASQSRWWSRSWARLLPPSAGVRSASRVAMSMLGCPLKQKGARRRPGASSRRRVVRLPA
jgi:hypothetical protein